MTRKKRIEELKEQIETLEMYAADLKEELQDIESQEFHTKKILLLVKPSVHEELKDNAWEHRTSVNNLINKLIEKYLEGEIENESND